MAYKLTKAEMETIIVFNEAESTASITTFNGILIRTLSALCAAHPYETSSEGPSCDGEYFFSIPRKHIKINAGRAISEERRQTLVEQSRNLSKKSMKFLR